MATLEGTKVEALRCSTCGEPITATCSYNPKDGTVRHGVCPKDRFQGVPRIVSIAKQLRATNG